jgi:hypothetical protein
MRLPQRRRDPTRQPGDYRNAEGKQQDGSVDADFVETRHDVDSSIAMTWGDTRTPFRWTASPRPLSVTASGT